MHQTRVDSRTPYIGHRATITSGQQSERDESKRYHLVARLGEGGFGTVYRAEDTFFNNRPVAIKSINLTGLTTPQIIEATDGFNREVMLLSGLAHPHLSRIYDYFTDPEHWYLVMDFIHGETLEEYLQRYQERPFPFTGSGTVSGSLLPLAEIFDIALQLCDVLDYLHTRQSPIIFRDLKPSNIMRPPFGQLYLIDFGIARLFKPGQLKDTIPFGSPGYAAPEQYGKAQTTPRADIYSLGALLHHLLTGHDPGENGFHFAPLSPLPSELDGLDMLIKQMLAINIDNRPGNIQEVKDRLESAMRDLGLLPSGQSRDRSVDPPQQPVRPPVNVGRRTAIISLATLAGVALAGGMGLTLLHQRQTPLQPIPPAPTTAKNAPPTPTPSGPTPTPGEPITFYTYRGHTDTVQAIAWSPDGKRIASAGNAAQLHVWNSRNGQRYFTCFGHGDIIQAVAWSPNGKYIASGSRDHTVRIWDAVSGQVVSIYRGHPSSVNAICWAPEYNGPLIVSGSDDPVVHIWHAPDTRLIDTHFNPGKGNPSRINAVSWGSLEFIVSGGEDTYIEPWGAPNSQAAGMGIYGINSGPVLALAWAPVAASRTLPLVGLCETDLTLRSWPFGSVTAQWTTSMPGTNLSGQPQKANVAWSPDGHWIACVANSAAVSVFNADTGAPSVSYNGHTGGINAVSCSPLTTFDGKLLFASGGFDKTVQIWQFTPYSS